MNGEWSIRRYEAKDAEMWDELVRRSRQGTLLNIRGYMDYHKDRFKDCSLIASRKGRPDVILPANVTDDGTLWSHQGLTYGGWLTPMEHFDGEDMLDIFGVWTEWCRENGISKIVYKPVPHIYHKIPAEEDIYALFRHGAQLTTVNLSSAIDLRTERKFNSQQSRNFKKAAALEPMVWETGNIKVFMFILRECLRDRHDASPVHSYEEMKILCERFWRHIRIFFCSTGHGVDAAVCVYDTEIVAHCQYIATSKRGRSNGTLAYLMDHLIHKTFASRRWFDLGTSNEDSGRVLNAGLLRQKSGFGACGVAYPTFTLHLSPEARSCFRKEFGSPSPIDSINSNT